MRHLEKQVQKQRKTNPFIWFIFAIVIPLAIAAILTLTVLAIAGVNVDGWLKSAGEKIPGISAVISSEEEQDSNDTKDAKTVIAQKNEEIEALEEENAMLEATIDDLEQDISTLEAKLSDEDTDREEDEEKQTSLKKISSSFKKMDHKRAAQIVENLERDIALSLLADLSNDTRGKIFEAMDPELAATLTEQLMDNK